MLPARSSRATVTSVTSRSGCWKAAWPTTRACAPPGTTRAARPAASTQSQAPRAPSSSQLSQGLPNPPDRAAAWAELLFLHVGEVERVGQGLEQAEEARTHGVVVVGGRRPFVEHGEDVAGQARMLSVLERFQELRGRRPVVLGEPRLRQGVSLQYAVLRELREGSAEAGLEHFEEKKTQTERRLLDGRIEASRDGLRESRRVGLELEEGLRLARDARGRVPGHVAPDVVDEGAVDGSHRAESPCDSV